MASKQLFSVPSQTGRSAIVTGVGGLGFETALALARAGAEVTLLGRNSDKGLEAARNIRAAVPNAAVKFELVDLASLASIKSVCAKLVAERQSLDLLINNAGVMAPPKRRLTVDGFELQFGTNYLGHFALTAQLLPLLRKSPRPRVIQVSSIAHLKGAIDFDNLQSERSYKPMVAYNQSKLANLMFALELQRRSDRGVWNIMSNAAHPGVASTDLVSNAFGRSSIQTFIFRLLAPLAFQSATMGSLPILYAATAPQSANSGYYGPDGMKEMKGAPAPATISRNAQDPAVAARLWDTSVRLTGVEFG
jgi:NAD(P)-dependent dehydrogenase (short-subunit alcohol dehydrogenase family)